jgi:hypothetical protein
MGDEHTQTPHEDSSVTSLLAQGIVKGLSEQISELGIRVEQLQTEIEATHHSDILLRMAGQVSNLEVRLSKVEKLLERIALRLEVPLVVPQQILPENVAHIADGSVQGELSPSSRRRDDIRHTGALKVPNNSN